MPARLVSTASPQRFAHKTSEEDVDQMRRWNAEPANCDRTPHQTRLAAYRWRQTESHPVDVALPPTPDRKPAAQIP